MRRITKIGIFITALVVILLGAGMLMWQSIASTLIEYSLQSYFSNNLDATLQVERIYRDNDHWIIEKPKLQGAIEGHADSMIVDSFWELWNRWVKLDIVIINPYIYLAKSKSESISESSSRISAKTHSDIFDIEGTISIENGAIAFYNPIEKETPQQFSFKLNGQWQSQDKGHYDIELHQAEDVIDHLSAKIDTEKNYKFMQLEMNNVNCEAIFAAVNFWKPLEDWCVPEGRLHGYLEVSFPSEDPPTISGNVLIDQLTIYSHKHQLFGIVPAAMLTFFRGTKACGDCELIQPASIVIQNQQIAECKIHNIVGTLSLEPEKVVSLLIRAACNHHDKDYALQIDGRADFSAGELKGNISLTSPKNEVMYVDLHTSLIDSSTHRLKIEIENIFFGKFLQNQLNIDAEIKKSSTTKQVSGSLIVSEKDGNNPFKMPFGLILERPHYDVSRTNWWEHALTVMGIHVKEGWMEARHIPLEKYITHNLGINESIKFTGWADIHATFNQNNLVLYYDAQDLHVGNDVFALEIPSLKSGLQNSKWPAIHYFDFKEKSHGGTFFLSDALYTDKGRNLVFTNLKAQVVVGEHLIHANNVEAFCNGLYCSGDLLIDCSKQSEGCLQIDAHAHTLSGKISQAIQLFDQKNQPLFLQKFPIEGDLSLRQEGGHFHLTILPHSMQFDAKIKGSLTDGAFLKQGSHISLRDLNLNFDYDNKSKLLEFSDIQGVLLVGSSEHMEEYTVAGDHIRCRDFVRNEADFDLWVGDRNRDIIRVVGKTQTVPYRDGCCVECVLDCEKTHFGDVHPSSFQLLLKNWTQIELLQLELGFHLSTLLKDLQRFSRTGLFFLSRKILHDLNDLKAAEGEILVNLNYDDQTSMFSYNAEAKNLGIGKYHFKHCLLNGSKKDSIWTIGQLKLDDLTFATEFSHADDKWIVNFLGVRLGRSILMGLEGNYFPQKYTLEAKVNLFEANLAHLNEWPKLHRFFEDLQPKGELKGTGNVRVAWTQSKPEWHVEGKLNTSLRAFEMKGIQFKDTNSLSITFNSDRNVELELPISPDTQLLKTPFVLKIRSEFPNLSSGEVSIHPQLSSQNSNPLVVLNWLRNKQGFSCQHFQGAYNGVALTGNVESIEFSPNLLCAKNLHVSDKAQASSMHIDHLEIKKDKDSNWLMTIPKLVADKIRPSCLNSIENKTWLSSESNLIIEKLEMENLTCNPFDTSSLHGSGTAHFTNRAKKDRSKPTLNIPPEEITKWGLDLSALSPETGTIQFELADQRIYLKKFKDMYSASHLSKFILPKKPEHPSFIDFDGNLFVQVKMKQNNLLFKLAELFTVTIQGKWGNPAYTISKQTSHDSQDLE